MAKQTGFLRLEGTIGDVTFVRTKDGFQARHKTGMTGDKIANDPAFRRTRENMAEFARAGKAGVLLRRVFRAELQNTRDRQLVGRLVRMMMKVLKSDTVSPRGQRTVALGDKMQLQGFDFNEGAALATSFTENFTTSVDRATGTLSVTLPSFLPDKIVTIPKGATHYQFISAAAAINFDTGVYERASSTSALLPWDNNPTQVITLEHNLTPNSLDPLFLVLGIEFMQEANGGNYSFSDKSFNALSVVRVDVV